MARIYPFQPYRYAPKAGPLKNLTTQPYDKISPEMRARYLALSPYNLVRVILGERSSSDSESANVYTRAAALLKDWKSAGILEREETPSLYAYFQEFSAPDSGERLVRKGFIGLGAVEEYETGVVFRHEQTLTGPRKDRMDLLKHTHAHFGQIFMLYPDPALEIDALLAAAAAGEPEAAIEDEYGVTHRVWRIAEAGTITKIAAAMASKKLFIADGHHRYETAQAFHRDNPALAGADRVMMTFVAMESPGLKILATHRVVHGLVGFDAAGFLRSIESRKLASVAELREIFSTPAPGRVRIGVALAGEEIRLIDRERQPGELDVLALHRELLGEKLGISEEAVRDEKCLHYVRGLEAAVAMVREGKAQVAFLLEPVTMEQASAVAFAGGVMPQKSTDFYPKLLSGLTIYQMD